MALSTAAAVNNSATKSSASCASSLGSDSPVLSCSALKVSGFLRVPVEEEEAGLDTSHHGGNAYNFDKELAVKA